MTADEAVVAALDALESLSVPYMIVGSLASNLHGIPRSTRDADFVVEFEPGSLQPFEGVTGTTRYLIELAASPFVCELFVLSSDPHDQERFRRRLRVRVLGRSAFIASAEDMVVTKLRWAQEAHRSKDLEDIRNILAVRGSDLDWRYLERWSREHGTWVLLQTTRESIPPV